MGTIETGRAAEEAARLYLERKGFSFLDGNYRTRLGELDLVMSRGEDIVFVEVKARKSDDFGLPLEAVGPAKQRKIVRAALQYIKARRLVGRPFRFDVVSLGEGGVVHLENAFAPGAGEYTL